VQGESDPILHSTALVATDISWVGSPPEKLPHRCKAKIRYRQWDSECTITSIEDGKVYVEFDSPQKAITPRQSIVFYDDDICLGGAMIQKSLDPYTNSRK
jgi:tRNA-uridine 2-sulfurtransferase